MKVGGSCQFGGDDERIRAKDTAYRLAFYELAKIVEPDYEYRITIKEEAVNIGYGDLQEWRVTIHLRGKADELDPR